MGQVLNHSIVKLLSNIMTAETNCFVSKPTMIKFDKAKYPKKKEQQWMAEKHQLQVEYYNVCLLIKQLSLAQSELEVLNKQISVEQEKLNQGNSTQLTVDDLNSRKRIVQDKITSLSQRDEGKNALKTRREHNVQFDPSFSIPSTVDGSDTYSRHHSEEMRQ